MRAMMFVVLTATLTGSGMARTAFWAPAVAPRAHYAVTLKFSSDVTRLVGTETIRFRNTTRRPIGRLALEWYGDLQTVRVDGISLERVPGTVSVALYDLPHEVAPGGDVALTVDFDAPWALDPQTKSAMTSSRATRYFDGVSPRLWWGFGSLDDYEVRVEAPEGYAVATSGFYEARTGTYRADGARAFGLFIGQGYESAEADAGGVRVRAVFTNAERPCAQSLLATAVDVIEFYRQEFGFYPHRSLTIVPGMDYPAGGFPAATNLVVVHGQTRLSERPAEFWRWIVAHEIGHMYWGDYVLGQGRDFLSWLMIGMGTHADRAYRRARGITGAGALETRYVNGVKHGFDTTMDVTEPQQAAIPWDFGNVVIHGKSAAFLNALESVVGDATFGRVYRRCLADYAGRQLDWRDFQRMVEAESGEDLGWLFEAWVRSPDSADYRVAAQACVPTAGAFTCTVRVERVGSMQMPVTVAAHFSDGSEQRFRTERLADVDQVTFQSRSSLQQVVVEPDGAVALALAPPPAQREVLVQVDQMPWTGVGDAVLEVYRKAKEAKVEDPGTLGKLGLLLYDAHHYPDALETMAGLAVRDSEWRFRALVWQGHLLDLLGRRDEAVACYQEALQIPGDQAAQFSQYNLVINKQWVEQRLTTPFARK